MEYRFAGRVTGLKPSAIREIFKVLGDPGIIPFAGGNPDPSTFPADKIRSLSERILTENPVTALQYNITEGYTPLRERVAARLKSRFGVGGESDTLLITTGGQQGIDLTCKVLCDEGDTVICESPSFIGALNAFRGNGARLRGIEMDEEGIDACALEETLKKDKRAKLIYLIPNFQNPSGRTMSLRRRREVLSIAERYAVPILEDNPYGELRFSGVDLPSLKSLDKSGAVIYCGSFSKILSTGLRVGFLCAPAPVAAKVVVAKQVNDVHTNILAQMLAERWMAECDVDAHIEYIRKLYGGKCRLMLEAAEAAFPPEAAITRPEGGIFLWCTLPGGDGGEFARAALTEGVAVVPGSAFMTDEGVRCPSFRLNYSMPSEDQIVRGMETIGRLIKRSHAGI